MSDWLESKAIKRAPRRIWCDTRGWTRNQPVDERGVDYVRADIVRSAMPENWRDGKKLRALGLMRTGTMTNKAIKIAPRHIWRDIWGWTGDKPVDERGVDYVRADIVRTAMPENWRDDQKLRALGRALGLQVRKAEHEE